MNVGINDGMNVGMAMNDNGEMNQMTLLCGYRNQKSNANGSRVITGPKLHMCHMPVLFQCLASIAVAFPALWQHITNTCWLGGAYMYQVCLKGSYVMGANPLHYITLYLYNTIT